MEPFHSLRPKSLFYNEAQNKLENLKKLLLPYYYEIPSHSYFASTLLRLVDTFGCTRKDDLIEDFKKTKTLDFLSYIRAATSGLNKAKEIVASNSHHQYYLDPSSVWKAFAIQHHVGHATYQETMDTYGHLLKRKERISAETLGEFYRQEMAKRGPKFTLLA